MKTSDLKDLALDWAAAKCAGWLDHKTIISINGANISWYDPRFDDGCQYSTLPSYSTDWAQGGPIIERERLCLYDIGGDEWGCDDNLTPRSTGPTPLIAAMRCYVASKLGDEIEIPEELQ